jgi:hypothetical protein
VTLERVATRSSPASSTTYETFEENRESCSGPGSIGAPSGGSCASIYPDLFAILLIFGEVSFTKTLFWLLILLVVFAYLEASRD